MTQRVPGPTGKALQLLRDIIALQGQPFNPEAYSRMSGMPVANLYRYLTALLDSDMLVRPTRGAYLPHPALLDSLSWCTGHTVLKLVIRPHLEKLVKKLPATLHFGIMEAEMITYLVKVAPADADLFTMENMQLEAYCSGIGKVLLSTLSRKEIKAYLSGGPFPNLTPYTITDPTQILQEIKKTERRGYGIDDREVHEQLVCLAVPVRSPKGQVIGAISAASMSLDLLGSARTSAIHHLRTAAKAIGSVF